MIRNTNLCVDLKTKMQEDVLLTIGKLHMQNGKYQIHMKTIDASGIEDRNDLAVKVYNELLYAFKIID